MINVHSIRDENTRRSQWNWISHRPSRDYFLADYLGTRREREKWRISLTMAKISTVKFYRGFRETIGHMAVICVYFTRRHTLRFFNSVHSFVPPPSCLGRNRSSTKHVWIYHNSYELFCSFFEWLQGLPRIIKSSSVAKIQRDRRKYLVRSSGALSIASLKRIYF